ncbi:hypothetical protein M409DRAFT_55929 [Zasmidium cellare ATCC 36951]|uniref:Cytochrome P450 n=1 Tax=Zasmidium cellare ATCC 36951 TaxID=1080233 RepID=A0A6A6CEA9_ZASCE|nr:uncharacterized protein M409DRAFT_55929 [Zasmidium cellare ATCC 36951]KAF2165557.1 hypothetical protein M409DRAFT_55929 [Zasmidium cellare ATCC 36951]
MEKLSLWIGLATIIGLLAFIWHCITYDRDLLPKGLPWGGYRPGAWFVIPRASFSELWNSIHFLRDGYEKYGKHGKPWVTPNRNWDHEVMLPLEHTKWLIELPESVAVAYKILLFDVAFLYMFPQAKHMDKSFHKDALRKMNWDKITEDVADEIDACTKRYLGNKPGKDVSFDLNNTMQAMFSHIATRAFLGADIAKDEAYLNFTSKKFMGQLLPMSILIRTFVPFYLQIAILWPLFQLPVRFYEWKAKRSLRPVIKLRLLAAQIAKDTNNEIKNPTILQNIVRLAVDSPDPRDRRPDAITRRMLAYNLYDGIGSHTLASSAINAMADILLAGPEVYGHLRAEAIAASTSGPWTKASVNRLVLLDSALRESLRCLPLKARAVERIVVAKEGVTLPNGLFVPYGTPIGLSSDDIHHDEQFYERPESFIPDRFVNKEGQGMVQVRETFQAFGLGRQACPGRYIAAHILKMFFAHIIINYDFDELKNRPPAVWASDLYLPKSVTLTCRRRIGGDGEVGKEPPAGKKKVT